MPILIFGPVYFFMRHPLSKQKFIAKIQDSYWLLVRDNSERKQNKAKNVNIKSDLSNR